MPFDVGATNSKSQSRATGTSTIWSGQFVNMGSDTEIFNKSQGNAWDRLVFWKLAIAKLICLCIMAGGGSLVATLNGVEWGTFTTTQKFTAITAALMAVTSTVLAFLSDTMQKLTQKAEQEKKSTML